MFNACYSADIPSAFLAAAATVNSVKAVIAPVATGGRRSRASSPFTCSLSFFFSVSPVATWGRCLSPFLSSSVATGGRHSRASPPLPALSFIFFSVSPVATGDRRSRASSPLLCSLPYFFLCFFDRSSGFLRALAVPYSLSGFPPPAGCLERRRRPTLSSSHRFL